MMNILFRADAGTEIGSGHVMRCLALAEAWEHVGECLFLTAPGAEQLVGRIRETRCDVAHLTSRRGSDADARETVAAAKRTGAEWVVVDGYDFDSPYQRRLKDAGLRVLFLDDFGHASPYSADIILNHQSFAPWRSDLYAEKDAATTLLLGSEYFLLRRGFAAAARVERVSESERSLFIFLGGGDPENVTAKIVRAANRIAIGGLSLTVVVGGQNPFRDDIVREASRSPHKVRLTGPVREIPGLMARSDLAISAGGGTMYELAYLGVPAVTVIFAENQRLGSEDMDRRGVTRHLGWHHDLTEGGVAAAIEALLRDADERRRMSAAGKALIDGNGPGRVLSVVHSLFRAPCESSSS